jgi:hypothetical protein
LLKIKKRAFRELSDEEQTYIVQRLGVVVDTGDFEGAPSGHCVHPPEGVLANKKLQYAILLRS